MAEPADVAIGFEGLASDPDSGQKSYTVKFSATDPEPEPQGKSEEIVLLERSESPKRTGEGEGLEDAERVSRANHLLVLVWVCPFAL